MAATSALTFYDLLIEAFKQSVILEQCGPAKHCRPQGTQATFVLEKKDRSELARKGSVLMEGRHHEPFKSLSKYAYMGLQDKLNGLEIEHNLTEVRGRL